MAHTVASLTDEEKHGVDHPDVDLHVSPRPPSSHLDDHDDSSSHSTISIHREHLALPCPAVDGKPIPRRSASRHSSSTHHTTTPSNPVSRIVSRLSARSRSLAEPGPPPDGGTKAWTMVACGWLVLFSTWGYVNSFGAFQTYYEQALPESPTTISWIGSVQVWLTFSVGAFSGRALDAGLYLPVATAGAVIQLVGVFMMSLSTTFWQLMITQGVLTGIGGGIFFCPSIGLLATYFDKRRGLAIGLASLGNAAGGLVFPVVVRELLPMVGFGWTARVLGFIQLLTLTTVLVFMRPRVPPRKAGPIVDWGAFREPQYVCLVTAIFFMMWTTYYTVYFIASFGTQALGRSYADATIMVMILNGTGLPPRIVLPWLADKYGFINVLIPTSLCLSITAFAWLAVKDVTGYYVFTVMYGLVNGMMQGLIPTSVTSITRRLDMIGTRLGMMFTLVSVAALTGPPLGAALQGAGSGWVGPQIWSALSAFGCFVMFNATRYFLVGWDLKKKC